MAEQPPTIADIRKGYYVHASCGGCGRSKKLDLEEFAAAHGENARLYYLAKRFRCVSCGWRGFGLALIPGPNTVGYARGHSHSQ